MNPIRVLPPELALKIAAGEVVERPASAVKELLDNALDAGAQHIRVEIREGGLRLIRVTDDGAGIPHAELALAFQSHATSKIGALDDLDRLATLGFRGEALPSIAAVSRIELASRVATADLGGRIRLEFGDVVANEATGAPVGTRVAISDLFGNVPARRKFVRSLRAETGRIQAVVAEYALAQPAVAFVLEIEEREILSTPGTGSPEAVLAAVYGAGLVTEMYLVALHERGIRVDGLTSAPSLSRATRSAIHLSVNGRPVANRSLVFALEEAYSGFLMTGRHPIATIRLELPPEDVDPNIHPAKNEVRFAREREVHGVLHRAVADTLLGLRLQERSMDSMGPATDDGLAEPVALPLDVEQDSVNQPALMPNVPLMRVFGQTNLAFIIAEGPSGLYMIDQHAAHERILFDRFEQAADARAAITQPLLEPVTVDLEPDQMAALDENRELLAGLGLVLEPFGHNACLVRAMPAAAHRESPAALVHEVLDDLKDVLEARSARERALAMMACKAAVKAGDALSVEEMRDLVVQLERTPRPNTCPHGRPTMIHLSHMQLEREFGRR